MYLINHSQKIKSHHLNKGKLHLNKKRSTVSRNSFLRETSKVFNWQLKNDSSRNFEECNFDVALDAEQLSSCDKTLKSIRNDNVNKSIFAYLNINPIRNKFELLKAQIKGNIDILMISETKIDNIFPYCQFLIEGFSTPERLHRDSDGGGTFLYVREDIHSILIAKENKPIESLF